MARRRMIAPEIWADGKFGRLDPFAQIVFVGLISNADDDGRGQGSASFLFSRLFPYASRNTKKMERALETIAAKGLIHRYEHGDEQYYCLPNWRKHQKISHRIESSYPKCPTCTNGEAPPKPFQNEAGNVPAESRTGQSSQGQLSQEKDKIEESRLGQSSGEETHAAEVTPLPTKPNDPKDFSSSLTDHDLDPDPPEAVDQDYYGKMSVDELASRLAGLPCEGRTKRMSGKDAFVITTRICEGFYRGEISEGWPRLERKCRKDPNAVSDLLAYFETTLLNMRVEGKFQKPGRLVGGRR